MIPDDFCRFADHLAEQARAIVLDHYRTGVAVEDKADMSPVTIADRAAEARMRTLIAERFPDHGMLGEEYGSERDDAEYVWVMDPIDGTKAFICGIPVFGTLIALVREGEPVLGVIDLPVTGERFIGGPARATTLNGRPVRTRPCASVSRAIVATTTPDMFEGEDMERFLRVRRAARLPRYGTDCYGYGLVAAGMIDLVIEADLAPYDYLGPAAVIEGAGGTVTDWEGRPLRLGGGGERIVAAGDPVLHAEVRRMLGEG